MVSQREAAALPRRLGPGKAHVRHRVLFPPAVRSKHHLLQSLGFLKARLQSRISSDAFPRLRVEGLRRLCSPPFSRGLPLSRGSHHSCEDLSHLVLEAGTVKTCTLRFSLCRLCSVTICDCLLYETPHSDLPKASRRRPHRHWESAGC